MSKLEQLENYINKYSEVYKLNGNIAVFKNDELYYSSSFGYSSVENNIKNNFDSRFRIASISKQFTAAAILLLEERGLLSLDDKISKYFPNIFITEPNVTIHYLLCHSSGFNEVNKGVEYKRRYDKNNHDNHEVIKELLGEKSRYKFGEKAEYSNYGYTALGLIIENISKVTLGKFLDENIFKKLGMENTGVVVEEELVNNLTLGYSVYGDKLINAKYSSIDKFYGSGNLYSTVYDLFLWSKALNSGSILKKQTVDLMNSKHSKLRDTDYGYGVFIKEDNLKDIVIYHSGGLNGVNTYLFRNLKKNIIVVLLFNKEVLSLRNLVWNVYNLAVGLEVELPYKKEEYKLSKKEINKFIGIYDLSSTKEGYDKIEVTLDNGKLSFIIDDFYMFYVYPINENSFQLYGEDLVIEFTKNDEGEVLLFGTKKII